MRASIGGCDGFRLWYRFGFGAPGNVLEVEVGTVKVDVPRSVGYFGGLSVAVGVGQIEPPLAPFIASVPGVQAVDQHRPAKSGARRG
jgi:hypothetical protein